ncbi:MAG: hypothetical protein NTU51_04340 [Bacteroidetes bacterium]|nr:hypothetical protein [Bacteroidota bacterium]
MMGKDKNISLIIFLLIFVICFTSWLHREKEHPTPVYSLSFSVISTSYTSNDPAIAVTPTVCPDLKLLFNSRHSGI